MMTFDEQSMRPFAGELETATGRRAGDAQIRAALAACAGGRAVVVDGEDVLLVAALAVAVAAGGFGSVHLALASTADAARLSQAFRRLGLDQVTCAPAETFVFEYLKASGEERVFAVVADAERMLLRDANTPVILARPPTSSANIIPPEVKAAADRLLQKGRDYVVQDGQIVVRDATVGDLFPGRRFSGGLHAAVEAREGLPAEEEGEVVAQITMAGCFRLYPKLAAIIPEADERYRKEYGLTIAEFSSAA